MIRVLLLIMAAAVLGGGSDLGDDPAPATPGGGGGLVDPPVGVSWAGDIQPILDNNCIGCHGAGGSAGLDLRSGVSHGNLVGVPSTESSLNLIEPGDPDQSWLYLKITGQQDVGDVMPPGVPLGDATIDLVHDWIEAGAADN
jgi:hypothetical protein